MTVAGSGSRVRALVLCAGRGQRLRPLTDWLAKPLLPVAGRPVAMRTIDILHRVGCETAVNLHHLAASVRRGLESRAGERGIELTFAVEPDLLGTLGAVVYLRDFLAEGDVVVLVNGDSLCRWPILDALARHRRSGADVTLQLGREAPSRRLGGGVEADSRGIVTGIRDLKIGSVRGRRRTFQGLHVLSRRIVDAIPRRPASSDIVEGLYQPLLESGARIVGFGCRRRWHDLGTPRRYLDGALDWGRSAGGRKRRRRYLAPGVEVERGAAIEHSVVESGCRLGADALVERSVLMPGVRVGAAARLRETIVAPGVQVPPGLEIEGHLVTPLNRGRSPASRFEKRYGIVFTALDPVAAGHPEGA